MAKHASGQTPGDLGQPEVGSEPRDPVVDQRASTAPDAALRPASELAAELAAARDEAPEGIDQRWFEGIELIARQFEDTLAAQGLAQIPAVGEKFDPSRHEAIAREETDAHEEGTVLEEMQPGYRLHDRVLRPTLV